MSELSYFLEWEKMGEQIIITNGSLPTFKKSITNGELPTFTKKITNENLPTFKDFL